MKSSPGPASGFVPLRLRLIGLLTLAVFVFGSINLILVGRLFYRTMVAEQGRRLTIVAELLTTQVVEPLLHDDRVALAATLDKTLASEGDLVYIVISGPDGRARWRATPGTLTACEPGDPAAAQLATETARVNGTVREVRAAILAGELGQLRVGGSEQRIRAAVARLLATVAAMVAAFLLLGIAGAVLTARRITTPLEATVHALDGFSLEGPRLRLHIDTRDELELLGRRIEEIADRLQALHRSERERDKELARVERLASTGTLAASLAHELNNPLAGIRNAAARLATHASDHARVERYAGVIHEASLRMQRSLNDLLGLARTPAPKLGPVDPCRVLTEALELAAPRLALVEIGVMQSCVEPVSLVRADRERLGGALLNLLLNAGDAVIGQQAPRVVVRCRSNGTGAVRLEVEDNGAGVQEELRERIFDPFFTTKPTGTGLGLPTAFAAVQAMGGRLFLEPLDSGSRFVIELQPWQEERHA